MFENIIVESALIPVRDAASVGDLKAMCKLARHIIDGDRTRFCPSTVEAMLDTITDHDDLDKDIASVRDTLKLMADIVTERYRNDEIDYLDYMAEMQLTLKKLVHYCTQYPLDAWPLEEMKNCMDWLVKAQSELRDYHDSGG